MLPSSAGGPQVPLPTCHGDLSPLIFLKRLLFDVVTSTHPLSTVVIFITDHCNFPLLMLTSPFSTHCLRTSPSNLLARLPPPVGSSSFITGLLLTASCRCSAPV